MGFVKTAVVIALIAASCGGETTPATTDGADAVTIANQGGDMEGHTPTAFAGSGTGLFAGDNLNGSFPEGVGVQLFVNFALPDGLTVDSASVVSDALHTSGNPFDDLGRLLIEPVGYETFGPPLFELEASADPTSCQTTGDTTVTCDVTAAVQSAVSSGQATAQFRIRFEQPADNDGQPDLALFYLTDSNTNEPGIFELQING